MFKNKKEKSDSNNKVLAQMPINTVIAEGITVRGDIIGEGAIRIDGRIEGNLELNKGVILGEKAEVTGKIKSTDVIVYGRHNGDLECKDLYIMETGRLEGNLLVNRFSVEMGGKYTGNLKMTTNEINLKEKVEQKKLNSETDFEKMNG